MCGKPLDDKYWVIEHPRAVHQHCRRWELERFPFEGDLQWMRRIARVLRRAFREVVKDGRWLAEAERNWPNAARVLAGEWHERKQRLEHHLAKLGDRLGR